jgi:hydrogenase maturation protease
MPTAASSAGSGGTDLNAPVLVLAIGNPSRGDDALGPLLAERLEAAALPGVEVIVDFQLQIEHALDLEGRHRVIIVDASRQAAAPFEWQRPEADATMLHTTHALSPGALLGTAARVGSAPPRDVRVLAVRGDAFELGAPLSAAAARHLAEAWPALDAACREATGGPDA